MDAQELNSLYLEKTRLDNELSKINERIKLVRHNIQNNCNHSSIQTCRDYDGHKWNVSNICNVCAKEVHYVSDRIIIK